MKTFIIILFSLLTFQLRGQSRNLDSLTKVLEEVLITDQAPRRALDSITKKYGYDSEERSNYQKKMERSDSSNLSIVSFIIEKYGWLGAKETSKKANDVLFLVIQHSDVASQLKYLPYLEAAVESGKASAIDEAYLVDRVRANQGKFQIYGTQFQLNAEGNWVLYPVEDEPNVNKRRRKVGLDLLEAYARKLNVQYHIPIKDSYKNKIVIDITLADEDQKPLADVEVYLGDSQLLGKTNKAGSYTAVIDYRDKVKGLTLKKDGYRVGTFALDQPKEVYTFVYILSKQ